MYLAESDFDPVNGTKVVMNSLPHHALFNMALDHLVQWVSSGVTPPRADRIELTPDGRYFAKDENGNSIGGVRCVQMDVPHSTYRSTPVNADGTPRRNNHGTEVPFDEAKMTELYGDQATYIERFNSRLDELISQGWLLPEDADGWGRGFSAFRTQPPDQALGDRRPQRRPNEERFDTHVDQA